MKSSLVFDTNIVCSIFNPEDLLHKETISLISDFEESSPIIIPSTVILELSVFQKYLNSEINIEIQNFLRDKIDKVYIFSNEDLEDFQSFVSKTRFSLKAMDYSILYVAWITGSKLLTFDKKLSSFIDKIRV